jgi:hypothetical protein
VLDQAGRDLSGADSRPDLVQAIKRAGRPRLAAECVFTSARATRERRWRQLLRNNTALAGYLWMWSATGSRAGTVGGPPRDLVLPGGIDGVVTLRPPRELA